MNTHKKALVISIAIVLIAVIGIIAMGYTGIISLDNLGSGSSDTERELFTKRLPKTSSAKISNHVDSAIALSQETTRISFDGCRPDILSARIRLDGNMTFANTGASRTELIFSQGVKLPLEPGEEKTLGFKDIFAFSYVSARDAAVRNYGCTGVKGSIGFIAVFPDKLTSNN